MTDKDPTTDSVTNIDCLVADVPSGRLPRTKHFWGAPRQKHGDPTPVKMPVAQMLAIGRRQNGFYVYRISAQGTLAGETHHETLALAKDQSQFEFGIDPKGWIPVPGTFEEALLITTGQRNIAGEGIHEEICSPRMNLEKLDQDGHYVESYNVAVEPGVPEALVSRMNARARRQREGGGAHLREV